MEENVKWHAPTVTGHEGDLLALFREVLRDLNDGEKYPYVTYPLSYEN